MSEIPKENLEAEHSAGGNDEKVGLLPREQAGSLAEKPFYEEPYVPVLARPDERTDFQKADEFRPKTELEQREIQREAYINAVNRENRLKELLNNVGKLKDSQRDYALMEMHDIVQGLANTSDVWKGNSTIKETLAWYGRFQEHEAYRNSREREV